jgi:hypothetical protein
MLHTIKREHPNKKAKAPVGRGQSSGKRGKTAGRGTKGQNARVQTQRSDQKCVISSRRFQSDEDMEKTDHAEHM